MGAESPTLSAAMLARVRLLGREYRPVKSLDGFRKGYRVPDVADERNSSFIAGLARPEIEEALQEIHAGVKDAFKVKRRELQIVFPEDNVGIVETPRFHFEYRIELDSDDPSRIEVSRRLYEVADAGFFADPSVPEVFGAFDVLEYDPPAPIDLEDLVDRVEDMEDDRITVEYDYELTHAVVTFVELKVRFRATRDGVQAVPIEAVTPPQLLDLFQQVLARVLPGADGPKRLKG